ncbi:hypothetical protein GCM10023185_19860 [Hymenobacter saemangeumensis]|uniref:Secretion system C-terminal sorting domain-containing protein n=2 Tax=Hymenobacter saemangeumensis TaxID=1084522 RepID=A0ABP8IDD0_9BACT
MLLAGSSARAQTTGPDGGTLSPAATTVCSGFNSGTLTLSGYTGSIVKYQFDNGNGFTDIAGSGGSPTYTFSNLTLTTRYRAVVQNGANPQVASTVATVTVNQPPTATINSQGPTRFCQQGTIFLVAGPSGNYTYQFLRNGINIAGATSQTYTATITNSGSYSVRVTDAAGCSAISSSIQIQVQPQNVVMLSASGSTTVCQGSSVLLTATTSGIGANNYTYQFERDGVQIPGATSPTYAATTSGDYRVVVNNPATCTSTSNTVTVTVVPVPTVTLSYSSPSYCQSGSPNPAPTYSPTGGSFGATPAGLSLNPSTGVINLANSNPGTYTVGYTSGGSCPGVASTSVTIIRAPQASFSYPAGSNCAGSSGSINAVLASGSTAGTFTASPAGLSLNSSTGAINLASSTPGTYTVTNSIAAANGCAATSASTQITLNAQPTATLSAGGPTTFCQGSSVVLTVAGGLGNATYQFFNNGQAIGGANNSSYTATASGSYTAVVTNPGGCTATSNAISVTVNPQTTATFSYPAALYCQNSGATPTPTITGTMGGTFTASPVGLSISASTGAINLAASTAGAYTVTYSVGGPCPSSSTRPVTVEAAPAAALTANGPTAFCQGGSVLLSATGGAAGAAYQFLLNGQTINGATNSTYTATASGAYSVRITSTGGCVATSSAVAVTVNPQTTAAFSYGSSSYCQNSGTTPTPTITGTPGGAFTSSPMGLSGNGSTGAINLANSLPGTYTVTYSVGGPCPSSSSVTVTVTAPAVATFSYAAPIYCTGGSNPAPVLGNGATAGTFTASPAGLSLNAGTGVINLSQSQPGTYTVTNSIAAAGGCPAASATTQVSISPVPVATLASSGPTTFCQGGSVVLTANGGGTGSSYQFLLNGQPISGATAGSYTATASGSYSVVITNPGSCSATSPATSVTVNPIATPTVSYGAASFCQNAGTTPVPTVSVAGGTFASTTGLSLNASTGAINLAASTPGTYTVTYTAGSPCPGSGTATVSITAAPSAAFAYSGSTFCLSGSNPTPTISGAQGGTFTAPAGLSISASTGTINLSASSAGSYAVTYSVAGACPASSTLTVTLTSAPVATFAYSASGYCAGSSALPAPSFSGGGSAGTFTATPAGLSLNASSGAIDLSQSQPGTYTVTNTIAASGACAAVSATASVTINAAPAAALTASGPTTFCQGSSVVLTATGGAGSSYQFLLNGQPISGATAASYTATAAGSYAVTVTNAAGCAATSAATTVTVNPATTATFTYPATTLCRSGLPSTPSVTGTGGGTFSATPAGLSLDTGTGTITPGSSQPGTYTVTYSVGGPCPSSGTATVTITAPAQAGFAYTSSSFCASGTAQLQLAPGSTAGMFTASPSGLSLNASTGEIDLSQSQPGTYTVTNTVGAAGGCAAASSSATLTVESLPAQPSLSYLNGTLTASGPATATYQFFLNGAAIPATSGASFVPTQNGSYTVVATSASGCSSLPSPAVMVVVTSTAAGQPAFTLGLYPNPTTDGRLTVAVGSHRLPAHLTVFNALGQEVFQANIPAAATSQELNLRQLPTGVYILRATTEAGTVSRRFTRE